MTLPSLNEFRDQEAGESNVSIGSGQSRVLIVDGDHPSMLAVYSMAQSLNSRIDAANGVEAALDCLKKSRYDAVITDLEMQDFSGYELANWIRDNSPDTRVVMMAERKHSETHRFNYTGIVDRWMFKPFGRKEFLMALDDFVPESMTDSSGVG